MTEARYRGQKVVVVSPDYSDHTKFADDWLPAAPGTDGALAMAMGHVILTEFFRDRQVPYFTDYVKTYTDAPFLVTLRERRRRLRPGPVPDRRRPRRRGRGRGPQDRRAGRRDRRARRPERLARASASPKRAWAGGTSTSAASTRCSPCMAATTRRSRWTCPGSTWARPRAAPSVRRGVPAVRVGGRLVTTVFDLLMAQYAVPREGLPGEWPAGYDDAATPGTPAWQEAITSRARRRGGPGGPGVRPQRRAVQGPVDDRDGRRHQPLVPLGRDLPDVPHADHAVRLPGRQRRRLGALRRAGEGPPAGRLAAGGVRAGLAAPAPAHDRHLVLLHPHRPVAVREVRPRRAGQPARPRPVRRAGRSRTAWPQASRLGWTPSHPAFGRNPLDLCDEAERAGVPVPDYLVRELREGRLRFAARGPGRPGELAAGADRVAGEPARLLGQGHGVLHAAPARHRRRGPRGGVPGGPAPGRGDLAGGGAARQAGPAHRDRLPDDQHLHVRRRGAARRHLVREARHLHHRHAPVRALVQPGHRAAVGDPHRLRRVHR